MKLLAILLLIPLLPTLVCNSSITNQKTNLPVSETPSTPPSVVMELFTSQGCSSCPPADRLLGQYVSDPNVIALSFHVDYWNNLGWKDPFSTAENSERQKMYASLGTDGVYTPQLIINGEHQMIGSDEQAVRTSLKEITGLSANVISIKDSKVAGEKINIQYTINKLPANVVVQCIFIQDKAITSIRRGENHGITLTNYNIVRSFNTIQAPKEGDNEFTTSTIPEVKPEHMSVVLLLQDKSSNRILAAVRTPIF